MKTWNTQHINTILNKNNTTRGALIITNKQACDMFDYMDAVVHESIYFEVKTWYWLSKYDDSLLA
mgnify:CR=1 FL=1